MDQHEPTTEVVSMNKQETVKDDGRTLIYYTFPPEGGTQGAPQDAGADAEAPHV